MQAFIRLPAINDLMEDHNNSILCNYFSKEWIIITLFDTFIEAVNHNRNASEILGEALEDGMEIRSRQCGHEFSLIAETHSYECLLSMTTLYAHFERRLMFIMPEIRHLISSNIDIPRLISKSNSGVYDAVMYLEKNPYGQ